MIGSCHNSNESFAARLKACPFKALVPMSQLSSRQQLYLAPKGTPSKLFASHFAAAELCIGSAGLLKEVSFHFDPGCFERVRLKPHRVVRPHSQTGADRIRDRLPPNLLHPLRRA